MTTNTPTAAKSSLPIRHASSSRTVALAEHLDIDPRQVTRDRATVREAS